MAKDKIHVQICIDGLDEMLDEIRQLQTYKLGEGNEKTLVGCDDVVNVFGKHLRTKVGTPSEPKWIPCSERLPEIDMGHPHHEDYLVQYDSGGIDVASWSNVNRFWTDHVTEPHWNCVQFAEVIAWMPLPEPYRRGEEE